MAQLIQRKQIWYTRFQYAGKDYWRSTGKSSKTAAKARAAEIQAEVKGEVSLPAVFDRLLDQIESLDETKRDPIRQQFARRLLRDNRGKLAVADVCGPVGNCGGKWGGSKVRHPVAVYPTSEWGSSLLVTCLD